MTTWNGRLAEDYAAFVREADERRAAATAAVTSDGDIRPDYYRAGGIEAWDVIEAWGLGFNLGSLIKYMARCGRKDPDRLKDLRKARTYLNREIELLERRIHG